MTDPSGVVPIVHGGGVASRGGAGITGPSVVEYKHLTFVLMDAPNDMNVKEVRKMCIYMMYRL